MSDPVTSWREFRDALKEERLLGNVKTLKMTITHEAVDEAPEGFLPNPTMRDELERFPIGGTVELYGWLLESADHVEDLGFILQFSRVRKR